jgi:hypothetical protein
MIPDGPGGFLIHNAPDGKLEVVVPREYGTPNRLLVTRKNGVKELLAYNGYSWRGGRSVRSYMGHVSIQRGIQVCTFFYRARKVVD